MKRLMVVWVMILCLVPLISLASGDSLVPAAAEEVILSHILPGYWEDLGRWRTGRILLQG